MEHAIPRRRPEPVAHPNGWWGTAIFVGAEATLFGALLGTYYYLRFKALHWPPAGIDPPGVALPLILAAVLVSTSVPMQIALRTAQAGRRTAVVPVVAALAVQGAYFAAQIHLFLADLDKFTPGTGSYGSIYFTLLGAHHAHVAVGLLLNVWLALRLATGLTTYRLTALWATTFYWHFVNALAVLVVLTQLSPSL
jgi:heme/copper-type cytochrome/quinol oxidase subunit 3